MLKAMIKDWLTLAWILLVLAVMLSVGCDENDPNFPDVHGEIRVDAPSPFPDVEVQFRDEIHAPDAVPTVVP